MVLQVHNFPPGLNFVIDFSSFNNSIELKNVTGWIRTLDPSVYGAFRLSCQSQSEFNFLIVLIIPNRQVTIANSIHTQILALAEKSRIVMMINCSTCHFPRGKICCLCAPIFSLKAPIDQQCSRPVRGRGVTIGYQFRGTDVNMGVYQVVSNVSIERSAA